MGGIITMLMAGAVAVFCNQMEGCKDVTTLCILSAFTMTAIYGFFASLILALED